MISIMRYSGSKQMRDRRLIIPLTPDPSGLLLPPGARGDPTTQSVDLSEFPPELRPQPPDLLLPASARPAPVTPESMMFCGPTPRDLDLPSPTLDDAVELIAEVPFEAAMVLLALLSAELYHHLHDRERQLELAAELYDGAMFKKVEEFVRSDDEHLAFDPRHVAALQRLAVVYAAKDAEPLRDLTPAELSRLLGALLAMAETLPTGDPPEPLEGEEPDWEAWARFTTQTGVWYDQPHVVEAIARAFTMYGEIAADSDLAKHHARVPVDQWLREDYEGLGLGEQLAAGLALAVGSGALDPNLEPAERVGRQIGADFLAGGAMAAQEPAVRRTIAADRNELRQLLLAAGGGPAQLAWDHTALEARPFLRRGDGRLLLLSPRMLVSWLTRGIHYRVLDAGNRRYRPLSAGKKLGKQVLDFTGALGERYVVRLVRSSLRDAEQAGMVRVHDEIEYHKRKKRFDGSDVVLDALTDVVLIEVYSGRLSREARVSGDPKVLRRSLDQAVVNKLRELKARTQDLLDGYFCPEGLKLDQLRRLWPMLVLAGDPVMQTPMLWGYLRETAPDVFLDDARVQSPLILDLDDLEPLMALVENGHNLSELLSRFLRSPYAQMPLRNWVHAVMKDQLGSRPRYVKEQFTAAMRLAGTTLFPGSERLANLEPTDME
jgi:hypothetical protein